VEEVLARREAAAEASRVGSMAKFQIEIAASKARSGGNATK
jgi:hypothetical protein